MSANDTERRSAQTALWRKLGHLFSAGVPMLEALNAIAAETADAELAPLVTEMIEQVRKGFTLSVTLHAHPETFSPTVASIMRAGEKGGQLDRAAQSIAEGLANESIGLGQPGAKPAAAPVQAETTEDQQTIELVTQIIVDAIESRASDIHFEPYETRRVVRCRIDGVMQQVRELSEREYALAIARIKIMAALDITERRRAQDGRIMLNIKGKAYDLRVSSCPYVFGESIVMRILDKAAVHLDLERCGQLPEVIETLDRWCHRPNGTIILTGPTGSGKTTTMYALLERIKKPELKIMTAENPVEFMLDGIGQCPVNPPVGMTFPAIIRSQLRQDPDVMMVGEIRDCETSQIIVQAALTGHLVITSLHTQDAPSALRRLVDIGLEPFLVTDSVIGVMAQRLCRQLCDQCKEAYVATADDLQAMGLQPDDEPVRIYRAKGCDACHNTGYRGRIALAELMEMNDALKQAVLRRAGAEELLRVANESGMHRMWSDGVAKVRAGVTSLQELRRATAGMAI